MTSCACLKWVYTSLGLSAASPGSEWSLWDHNLPDEPLAAYNFWGRGRQCLQLGPHWEAHQAPEDIFKLMVVQMILVKLRDLRKQTDEQQNTTMTKS